MGGGVPPVGVRWHPWVGGVGTHGWGGHGWGRGCHLWEWCGSHGCCPSPSPPPQDVVTGLCFGRYGREDNTLITTTRGGCCGTHRCWVQGEHPGGVGLGESLMGAAGGGMSAPMGAGGGHREHPAGGEGVKVGAACWGGTHGGVWGCTCGCSVGDTHWCLWELGKPGGTRKHPWVLWVCPGVLWGLYGGWGSPMGALCVSMSAGGGGGAAAPMSAVSVGVGG